MQTFLTWDYTAGRNDPCPCGSGKKLKKCCLEKFNIIKRMMQSFGSKTQFNYAIDPTLIVECEIPL